MVTSDSLILENAYRRNHKVRTVEDLMRIPLDKSSRIIKPVMGTTAPTYILPIPFSTKMLKNAWAMMQAYEVRRTYKSKLNPFTRWQDKIRYWLHVKLIRWGVIV